MPISDSFILRKIRSLHRGESEGRVSRSPSSQPGGGTRANAHAIRSVSRKTSDASDRWLFRKPVQTDVEESFAIHKYFDSDYRSLRMPLKADFAKAALEVSVWPTDQLAPMDVMNWSTPSASTEVETVMAAARRPSNTMGESDLWDAGSDPFGEPTTPLVPEGHGTPTEPRVVNLPERVLVRGQPMTKDHISSVQEYIESLCDFSDIFAPGYIDFTPSAFHKPNAHGVVANTLPETRKSSNLFMQHLTVTPTPESGRRTPLLLKSSNWRCKSALVVDITQEWMLDKDPEEAAVQAFFCPIPGRAIEPDSATPTPNAISEREHEWQQPLPASRRNRVEDVAAPAVTPDYFAMPRSKQSSPEKKMNSADYALLRQTVDQVQCDLNEARNLYRRDVDDDALQIERAILEMSEKLAQATGPVSKAQAAASEELLRTRLADMILNLPSHHVVDPAENYDLLKEPINLLRQKLSNLEHTLVVEEEQSIKEELQQITKMSESSAAKRKSLVLRRRSQNLARMTPLIHVVKSKLNTLEDVVDDNEEKKAARRSGHTTPVSERRTLHDLLWKINSEINNIHDLCRTSKQIDSLNTVIDVLSKVCTHLDRILDTLRQWQTAGTVAIPVEELKNLMTAGATLGASDNVTVTVDFKKEEEHEMTNTFVMFTSGSDKSTIGTSVDLNFARKNETQETATVRKSDTTHASSQVYIQFPASQRLVLHQQSGSPPAQIQEQQPTPLQRQPIQQHPPQQQSQQQLQQPVPPPRRTPAQTAIVEVPYIHLTAPACQPSSSDQDMEVSIHLRRRGDHQRTSAKLPVEKINLHLSQFMTSDTNSVQMLCEESDCGTDTDTTSAFFRGTVRTFMPHPIEEESSDVLSFTSEDSPLPAVKFTGQWKTFPGGKPTPDKPSSPPILVIQNKLDERPPMLEGASDEERSYIEVTNVRNSWNENFDLARKRRNYKVNAVLFPEQKAATEITFLKDHVDVDVERASEKGRDSVLFLEEAFDQDAVKLKLPRDYTHLESTSTLNVDPDSISNVSGATNKTAELSISVNAKSVSDKVFAHLEEIPWGKVSMTIGPETFDDLSDNRSGVLFNVMVSENQDEAKSQRSESGVSYRSSQKSLNGTDKTSSQPSLNVPTYVIKHSSTASITCELNNYVNKECEIEWYKGKEPVPKQRGKFDRISHDLLEVLVINQIEFDDSELYSIKVNGELYPVAFLIVEEAGAGQSGGNKFVSPNRTMFVMEGQKTNLACQMSEAHLPIVWYHDQELLQESERIRFQATDNGWYHVHISDTDVLDQGTYYAYYDSASTYITLVVEERIDEKEVQVSGAETDDDDLNDYLVPPGSTATIACELESTEFLRDLVWQKNHRDLSMSDKLEHVVNGNKHYLIIHNAQPEDSGVYSVRINETQFKVAQITITEGHMMQGGNSGSRLKRISNNSLQSFKS